MRKLVFGYSTRCNIRCEHCVAVEETPDNKKMDHCRVKEIIVKGFELRKFQSSYKVRCFLMSKRTILKADAMVLEGEKYNT